MMQMKKVLAIIMVFMIIFPTVAMAQGNEGKMEGLVKTKVSKISEKSSYLTSIQVAREFAKPEKIVIAMESSNSDTILASSLSAKYDAPIILLEDDKLDKDLKDYIHDMRFYIEEIILVDGTNSISETFEAELNTYLKATSKTLSANGLEKLMLEQEIKIFDLRSADDFEKGHIPGAINIGNKEFEDPDNEVDGEIATVEQFEKVMSSYGIKNDDLIVVYSDAAKPQMAPRLIWTLEVYDHNNTYVLDGHYQRWVSEGREIETGPAKKVETAVYKVLGIDNSINVSKEAVTNKAESTLLLDVRPIEEFKGEKVANGNARGGHIPEALNLFYMDTVDEDGFFYSPEYLTKIYSDIGINSDSEVIVYCQRGHRASHSWFVLKHILGYEDIKVYDGSMMEWSNREELPIVLGQ